MDVVDLISGTLLLLSLADMAVNSEVTTCNAALNKTAYQSSVYVWRGRLLSAHLANDGSRETIALRGDVPRCSASRRDINPWWAVDLGRPTEVYAVNFTNRGDCCADRSDNFIIGLTNVSPVDSPPTIWNYTLCGQYPGAVPAGATVSLYCQNDLPPFRYVIVQFPRTDYMNFCELEVFVRETSGSTSQESSMITLSSRKWASSTEALTVHETSTSSLFSASANVDSDALSNGVIIGITVGVVLLLLLIIAIVVVVIVAFRKRRKANNAGNQHVIATPNIYGTSVYNGKVQPSAPSPRSTVNLDHTLIDNDLYENTTAQNGLPTTETPSNMVEMNPMEQHPDPPVYAVVQKNRPGNFVVQSKARAPASNGAAGDNGTEQPSALPSRSSIDYDTTLIDNDLYQ